VTLENARMAAQPTLAGQELDDDRSSKVTLYARRVFTEALREAAASPGHVIAVADLLRLALSDETGGACRTLEALGVEASAVRAGL
jgi:hypothetical protein